MPHYLDNIWGDQATVRGFGDALNSNMASLVEARSRMRQQEQNAALNAAYYALERQKFQAQQPYQDALTKEAVQRAEAEKLANQIAIQRMGDMHNIAQGVAQNYLMANPPMQRQAVPSAPVGVPPSPGFMAGPQTQAMMPPPPLQPSGPVFSPYAPTMENSGRMNTAGIQGALAAQASGTPAGALALLQGQQLRPGDVPVNIMTQRQGAQIPGFTTPYQQFEEIYKMQALDALNRDRQARLEQGDVRLDQGQQRIDKPPKPDKFQALLDAAKAKKAGGGTSAPVPGQRDRQVAVDKQGNKIVSYDNWATYQPLQEGE